ncbi:malate dehydrogenase, cytoplasmic-like [Ceratitis capitata]|uniref:malate dehydrogenase, cytoplasmic-like n=1 Tax=Ceratitis capitata TaxID=7213 RepID=UPI0003296A23|nr:malate dehydrogenase, cytoplasmic-like [Ceratitis capitata]
MSKEEQIIRVLITGAAGQVAYSLAGLIACGMAFGPKQPLILNLLDLPEKTGAMEGLRMELIDSACPLLRDVIATSDPVVAFQDISYAFLLGGERRRQMDMKRYDLIASNSRIFKDQGLCLDALARKDCKVVVLTEPSNTMCYVCAEYAPSIPRENFTANARLDYNRAVGQIASKLKVSAANIRNMIIWGNHSDSMHPDCSVASVVINNKSQRVSEILGEEMIYFRTQLSESIVKRGNEIITARGLSSGWSAAKAVCDQMRDWITGTPQGIMVPMTVVSDGSYGTPKEIFFTFPVEIQRGRWSIVRGIKMDEVSRSKIDFSGKELMQEKMAAVAEIGEGNV